MKLYGKKNILNFWKHIRKEPNGIIGLTKLKDSPIDGKYSQYIGLESVTTYEVNKDIIFYIYILLDNLFIHVWIDAMDVNNNCLSHQSQKYSIKDYERYLKRYSYER